MEGGVSLRLRTWNRTSGYARFSWGFAVRTSHNLKARKKLNRAMPSDDNRGVLTSICRTASMSLSGMLGWPAKHVGIHKIILYKMLEVLCAATDGDGVRRRGAFSPVCVPQWRRQRFAA